ncbi:hypothetical protein AVI51_07460 [Piscirickettsia salmonis]|uniref:Uncharacterized protein n=1 Tax=Piscirickettsia salmonis TaxID=1238 RepID=A0A9Q5V9V0_PISSA|nr:hypothetical protein [Piscirickettsia salmonis]RNC77570.1 hypothetical protein DA717_09535 [Piscirickettsiaceae bacterium NZ-RLO2]ALA25913.1 membrane protein [Piscirickettsia salmonis]APS43384.1 hypothetical protein AVI48_02670 [Piscirickettsia salmonis]APS46735.1 hypothetical protein AVI49_03275 [Piscirickettsia salmonis]APS50708.1 hypothetical protein AVI50_07545 [Piscirickettsia salmonis]
MVSREQYGKLSTNLARLTAIIIFIMSLFVWGYRDIYSGYMVACGSFILCAGGFILKVYCYGPGDGNNPLTIKECISLYCFKAAWLLFSVILFFTAVFLLVHMTINFFAKG